MKKLVSLLLVVLTIASLFTTISFSVSAATTGFDILSGSKYAKVYTLKNSGNTIPYTTSKLDKRGSVTYGASVSAYIANSTDELYLLDVGITNSKYWAKVTYPVGNKRATAYIALSAITTNNASHAKVKSSGKFYCAPRISSSTSSSYYVAKGDVTYLIATDGNKYQILYPLSDGKYRIGWCSKSDYNRYCGTAVTSVSLNKTSATLTGKGVSTTFTATVKPTNATDKTLTWKSSNTKVAKVSNSGKVTSVGVGTATITATSSNGKTVNATVKVKSASSTSIKLNHTSFTLNAGSTKQLTATVTPTFTTDTVKWTSSNTKIATVSEGKVTAISAGVATITAKTTSGKVASSKVTVKSVPATSIKLSSGSVTLTSKGANQTVKATLTPSNSTDKVTWSTSNKSVATVSNGKITAVANGSAKITATTTSGKKATVNVKVSIETFSPVWPCKNSTYITTMYRYYNYGNPSDHKCRTNKYNGIDIANNTGDTIYSIEKGTVVEKSYDGDGFGYYVVIKHENGLYSLYAHLKKHAIVNKGDTVSRKQVIGYMGNTGNSSGVHLHFEVYNPNNYSKVINPWTSYYQGKVSVVVGGNSYKANKNYKNDSRAQAWCSWLLNNCNKNSNGDYVYNL